MIVARQAVFTMLFVAFWTIVELLGAHLQRAYSGYQVVWTRYVVHLVFMLAVWGWHRPMTLLRTERPAFQLSRSLLMVVMPVSWIIGLSQGIEPRAMTVSLLLVPLLVLLTARLFLRETASLPNWGFAVALVVGTGVMIGLRDHVPVAMLAFPLAVAGSLGVYTVMTRSLRNESMLTNLLYTAFGVALVLTPLMPAVWVWPGLHDWLVLVGIGLGGFASLLALDRATAAAPASTIGPILGVLFTASLLIDVLSIRSMAGQAMLVTLLCVFVVVCALSWRQRQTASREIA
jgi:drug/metabolite transporter (DMT)-like permease